MTRPVLTESGDILGAQKIILEEVGGVLLPAVEAVAGFIGDTFIPGIRELFSAFQSGESDP